jgi:thiol-disulfide isomerase/thioredoxin
MPNRLRSIMRFAAIAFSVAVVPRSFADDPLPDPRALLRGVEQDRLAIASGRVKLDVIESSARTPREPSRAQVVLVFDGEKCKADQDRRFLMIDWIRGGAPSIEKRNRLFASWGDPEMIVREGLGHWLDKHSRVIYDGTTLMRYSPGNLAYVSGRNQGSGDFLFNPRILGLSSTAVSPAKTASMILTPRADDMVSLVGREMVDRASAWHVLISGGVTGTERHFWIEPPPGHRLYKAEYRSRIGRSVIVSEYDSPESGDAGRLPVRVKAVSYDPSGKIDRELVVERSPGPKSVEFNIAIDPKAWTLAGLEMPIGEPVSDRRNGDKVVYWDGKTLSDTQIPQPPKEAVAVPRPSVAKLLEVARRDPADPLAMDAAAEIANSDNSAPGNREALGLLTEHHAGAKGVGAIGLQLIDTQPEGAEALFRAILKKNPGREDQGHACFGLAEILKTRSEHTGQIGSEEAGQLFERVVSSYADVRRFGRHPTIGELAKTALADLRTVGIGKPAPDLDGMDLDGKPLRLSDYRGKVVVVAFWATWCNPCLAMVPQERELVARMRGRQFALLGVNCDGKQSVATATRDKESMTWASWWLGESRTRVTDHWGVRFLPTTYILDGEGVIRFKNLRGEALSKAVDSLMEEAGR